LNELVRTFISAARERMLSSRGPRFLSATAISQRASTHLALESSSIRRSSARSRSVSIRRHPRISASFSPTSRTSAPRRWPTPEKSATQLAPRTWRRRRTPGSRQSSDLGWCCRRCLVSGSTFAFSSSSRPPRCSSRVGQCLSRCSEMVRLGPTGERRGHGGGEMRGLGGSPKFA
jgi:hypothetical protein